MAEQTSSGDPDLSEQKPDAPDCPTCDTFEPQAWRKSLCRNCFHALEEHAEDLLAAEAKAYAREMATGQKAEPRRKLSSSSSSSSLEFKEAPKTAPKPDMKTKTSNKTSSKDSKEAESSSSSSSASSTASSAPKSAREKLLEKFGKTSDKNANIGKDGTPKSGSAGKAEKKAGETETKSSASSSSLASSSLSKSTSKSSPTTTTSPSSSSSSSSASSSASINKGTTPSASESALAKVSSSANQKSSKLKEATSAMESKLSSTKPGSSQPKPQEVRIPGASSSSLSSKLSAFTEKASGSESSKKTLDSKVSPKGNSDSSKSSSSLLKSSKQQLSSKKEPETKESNIASKFAKFGGGKLKDNLKDVSETDSKSKPGTTGFGKRDTRKPDTPTVGPSSLSKAALFEKDSVNKSSAEKTLSSSSLKSTKDSPLSKAESSPSAGKEKEWNKTNSKDMSTSKLALDSEKKQASAKKSPTLDKSPSKLSAKIDNESVTQSGSLSTREARSSGKPGASTPETGSARGAGAGGGDKSPGERARQVTNSSNDVTGKYLTRSSSDEKQASPRSSLGSSSGAKEKGEKDGGQASTRINAKKCVEAGKASEDRKAISSDNSGNVDPRTKHSASSTSPLPADSIKPCVLVSDEQASKLPGERSSKKPSDLSIDVTTNGSAKTTPSPLSSAAKSNFDNKSKFRDKDLPLPKSPSVESLSPNNAEKSLKNAVVGKAAASSKDAESKPEDKEENKKLKEQLKNRDEELTTVKSRLLEMEKRVKELEKEKASQEKEKEKNSEKVAVKDKTKQRDDGADSKSAEAQHESHKKDLDTARAKLAELQAKLDEKENQCERLTSDNQDLKEKLKSRPQPDNAAADKEKELKLLENDLEAAERELEETREDNKELRRQVMEMRNEMDEMSDSFRESELEEFREMQRELEMASKNCRILQFKLRKSERRNIQTEEDRANYEDKLRQLEAQFDSTDARNHIQVLEEELRVAKEVSVRLHDELDIVEDKRLKVMEENRHLTELLEHTDKRQFRMEMEIDKLRDLVCDLKQQLKEANAGGGTPNNQESSPDRKPPSLAVVGQQGSKDYDISQLMKDLYDSMERENDLKDQLKFTEEEAKLMRRRVSDMDEENESLRVQLQRMSEKASKHKRREKEREKQLEEERKEREVLSANLARAEGEPGSSGSDVILVVGAENSDVISGDEPIPVTQRKDSTDEDLMNVMQLRIQLEMLEQELLNSHKKLDEMDLENENLQEEVKFLQGRLSAYESQGSGPRDPPPEGSGGAAESYWEEKVRELAAEADDLRWKLIEKDREMERMTVTRHGREHHSGRKQQERLKKSRSLEAADTQGQGPPQVSVHTCDLTELRDLRRQLEHAQSETAQAKRALQEAEEKVEQLQTELAEVKGRAQIPSVKTDDAALENIELRDEVKRMEQSSRSQAQMIKSLTETLHRLSSGRDPTLVVGDSGVVSLSEQGKSSADIPGIPSASPETQTPSLGESSTFSPSPAFASINQIKDSGTRDLCAELHALRAENLELRRLMAVWGVPGSTRSERRAAGGGGGGADGEGGVPTSSAPAAGSALTASDSKSITESDKDSSSSGGGGGGGGGGSVPVPPGSLSAVLGEGEGSRDGSHHQDSARSELSRLDTRPVSSPLSQHQQEESEERKTGDEERSAAADLAKVVDYPDLDLNVESLQPEYLSRQPENTITGVLEGELGKAPGKRGDDDDDDDGENKEVILGSDINVTYSAEIIEAGTWTPSFSENSRETSKHEEGGALLRERKSDGQESAEDTKLEKAGQKEEREEKAGGGELFPTEREEKKEREEEEEGKTMEGREQRDENEEMNKEGRAMDTSKEKRIQDSSEKTEDGQKDEKGAASSVSKEGKKSPKEGEKKPKASGGAGKTRPLTIMERYPGGKSKVVTSGSESRLEMMEKVLDMDDEIGDLINEVRRKEEEVDQLNRQIKSLNKELMEVKDESRRTELELLQELDMMQDKNSVMSNLLDIINERAEAAEEELERRLESGQGASSSPARAGSNVSQVSALSDTSTGSDEVFVMQYAGAKEGALTRDWEAKLKVRIESLERLLAEERQKVSTAEKKLMLAGIGTLTPSVTDDIKLRLREKELLQNELMTSQHHLQIATDQIKGLKERVSILEDEHARLKEDYGKLYEEMDESHGKADGKSGPSDSAGGGAEDHPPASPDGEEKGLDGSVDADLPFVSKRISVVEAPKYRELRRLKEEEEGTSIPETGQGDHGKEGRAPGKEEEEVKEEEVSISESVTLMKELELYKEKTRELEFKVEEINDIWKSKSDATEKERDEIHRRLNERTKSLVGLEEKINDLKMDVTIKNKIIAEKDKAINETKQSNAEKDKLIAETKNELESKNKAIEDRDRAVSDKEKALADKVKMMQDKDKIITELRSKDGRDTAHEERRRQMVQEYGEQLASQEALISQRESTIRSLDAAVRTRDERLKEKDDILRTLNSTLAEHKREMSGLGEKLTRSASTLAERDAAIAVLRAQLPEASVLAHDGPSKGGGETDAEKEGYRLKAALEKAQAELKARAAERKTLEEMLEESRKSLEDAMVNWDKDRSVFQGEINVLEEKVRLYEMYNPRGGREEEAVEGLKKELGDCFGEREALLCELSTLRLKMDAEQRAHKGEIAKLQGELTEKLKMLKSEVDNNTRVSVELDRLRRQSELGYRVQQELRMLKADNMAMKVRYETRIDKMSKDHNKMLLTIDQLQKERDRDRETVLAIQKNLSLVKDKYTEELLKSEEDKSVLGRQRAELEESRGHLEILQKHLRELKEKTCDQDRLRSDLINRFSTERASWEIERANLHSQMNQLREHISCNSKQEERSKDIQVNMGLAWEKERGEQRRLLQEAHTLALDLQEQLKTRDEASTHDRKELLREVEAERQTAAKNRREWERRVAELDTTNRRLTALQDRMKEMQATLQKEREVWNQERSHLSRQITEVSNTHARDVKRVEDVLSNLIRLRELGSMALPDDGEPRSPTDDQTKTCVVNQAVLDFAKLAVYQMNQAADDLTAITSPTVLDKDAIKTISGSEMDLVKQEFIQARRDTGGMKGGGSNLSVTQTELDKSATQRSFQSVDDERRVPLRGIMAQPDQPPASRPTPANTSVDNAAGSKTVEVTPAVNEVMAAASTAPRTSTAPTSAASTKDVESQNQLPLQQKELTKEQQKQLQKDLKKKKKEEEQQLKKQKKKSKEGGGGFGSLFGRHDAEKSAAASAKLSPSSPPPQASIASITSGTATTTTTTTVTTAPISSSAASSSSAACPATTDPWQSVTPRPFDFKRNERPPSYASGTRSAQGSRATTPEVPDVATWPKQAHQAPPVDTRHPSQHASHVTSQAPPASTLLTGSTGKPRRPVTFSKSISVDSAPAVLDVSPSRRLAPSYPYAVSPSDATGRQQWTDSDLNNLFSSLPHPRSSSSPRTPVISVSTTPTSPAANAESMPPESDHPGLRAHSASPHREKLSPRSARRKFFAEYPTSSSPSPSSEQYSPPTLYPSAAYEDLRRSVSPSRLSVEEAELAKSNHAYQQAQAPPSQMTSSASWDEKMHYRITQQEESKTNESSSAATPSSAAKSKPKELSAKEKRGFFKKSSSLDSTPVGASIAHVGVAAAPVAAPSNFAPSDFFAAVKGKLKPVFKRKSGGGSSSATPTEKGTAHSAQDKTILSEEAHSAQPGVASSPVSAESYVEYLCPEDDKDKEHREEQQEFVAELPRERSRDTAREGRGDNPPRGKWRSKSADRVSSPAGTPVHGDVIRPASGTWKFNETAV